MAEPTTYLVLLLSDERTISPGLWCTKSDNLSQLIHNCGLRFTTVHIFELEEQPSPAPYVPWGGMKLHHVAHVEPNHALARASNLLQTAMMDLSKEQIQAETQGLVDKIVATCQRRLMMKDEEDPQVEVIELGRKEEPSGTEPS